MSRSGSGLCTFARSGRVCGAVLVLLTACASGCGEGSRIEIGTASPPAADAEVPRARAAAATDSGVEAGPPSESLGQAAFHVLEISNKPGEIVTSSTLLLSGRRIAPLEPSWTCPVSYPTNESTGLEDRYVTPEPYSWMAIRNPFDTDFEITVYQTKIPNKESYVYPRFYVYAKDSIAAVMDGRTDCHAVGVTGDGGGFGYELSLTLDKRLSLVTFPIQAHTTQLVYSQFDPPYSKATLLQNVAVNVNVRTNKSVQGLQAGVAAGRPDGDKARGMPAPGAFARSEAPNQNARPRAAVRGPAGERRE